MARRLVWTESAQVHLREIAEYISEDSLVHATRVIQRIVESTERLRNFPQSGRRVPDMTIQTLREVIVDNYRIMYESRDTDVYIVAVIHGRRALTQ